MQNEPLTLQPMSMGEIFDKAIRLYKNEFSAFAGVFMLAYVPLAFIRLLVETLAYIPTLMDALNNPVFNGVYSILILLPAGVQRFLAAMIASLPTAYLVRMILKDEEISIRAAYKFLWGRLRVWISSYGLLLPVFGVMLLWAAIPIIGWAGGVGLLAVFVFIAPKMLGIVLAFEDETPAKNLRRVWDLLRIRFWWLLLFMTGLFFFERWLSGIPGTILQSILISFIENSATSVESRLVIFRGAQIMIKMVSDMLYMPVSLIIMTLVYMDLRARAEGLDLQMKAMAGMEKLPNDSSTPILTRRDFVNLLWVSLFLIALALWAYQNPDFFYVLFIAFSFWFP